MDPFDLILHVAFDKKKLKSRRERAEKVRKSDYFKQYGEAARNVLSALLEKYADEGLQHIEDMSILNVSPLTEFGSPVEIVKAFGGRDKYIEAIEELEKEIYN
jgi:type I restriction enzyme R subunit